jgi:hypothetical protein
MKIRNQKREPVSYTLVFLAEKFDFVPKAISEDIDSIDNSIVLDELLKKIIKINTVEEFKMLLERAKNID